MIVALVLSQCFVLSDPTPGWKHVALPVNAPDLAAPDDVDQFRTDDVVTVLQDQLMRRTYRASLGRQTFEIDLPPGTRTMALRFAKPLDGAKIDAVIEGPRGRVTLLDERRASGLVLSLPIPNVEATLATVTVHHHLRDVPWLETASLEREVVPRHSAEFPAQLKLENALYVLSAGRPMTLCERKNQPLRLHARSLEAAQVRSATLEPVR